MWNFHCLLAKMKMSAVTLVCCSRTNNNIGVTLKTNTFIGGNSVFICSGIAFQIPIDPIGLL